MTWRHGCVLVAWWLALIGTSTWITHEDVSGFWGYAIGIGQTLGAWVVSEYWAGPIDLKAIGGPPGA